jgi:hypothetical protein
MKNWFTWFLAAGLGAGVSHAGEPVPTAAPAAAIRVAASGGVAPAPGAKQEEPPPEIEGMEISRGSKGFLGVQIVDGRFRLSFYDPEKKPTTPDVMRAALRWNPSYKVGMERVVLNPGAENTLTSDRFIRPPHNFKLFIVLVNDASAGEEPVGESYTIDFRQ